MFSFLRRLWGAVVEDRVPDVCSVCYDPFLIRPDTQDRWPRMEPGVGDIHNNAVCRGKAIRVLLDKASGNDTTPS